MCLQWCFPIHFNVSVVLTKDSFLVLALPGLRNQIIFGNINSGATFKKKALSRGSSIYTKHKEKEIKAYHYGKSSVLKGRQYERKQGIKELQKTAKKQ